MSVEVGGGDLGGGESEGRVGAICFYFPQPLAFFGFSPNNFLIRAKINKLEKRRKVKDMTPFSNILSVATRVVNLVGEVGVVVFLLGGWTLAPRRKFEKKDCKFE